MNDEEHQLEQLQRIYEGASRSPFLKRNPLSPNPRFDGIRGPFRIAYGDVMDGRYIVRCDPAFSENAFWSEQTEPVAEYDSLAALVRDGWRLD